MRYDRIAAMNRANDRAPASGGKLYRQTARRAPTPAMGTWERLAGLTVARWECATGDAIAQFRFDVFGSSWEGL